MMRQLGVVVLLLVVGCSFCVADDDDDDTPFRSRTNGDCGGYKQICCRGDDRPHCLNGLQCLRIGGDKWVGAIPRCVRPRDRAKERAKCGTEGIRCCPALFTRVKPCGEGMECMGDMCRKPGTEFVGQTTVSLTGWVKVMIRANGERCFVQVDSFVVGSVETTGEGTFGEVFGDLQGLGLCEDGASGVAIGFIKAEVLASATLNENGECDTTSSTDIFTKVRVNGEGLIVGVGGDAGANVGCLRRRKILQLLGYV